MAIGYIFWSISPKIVEQVYDEPRDSTPNKLWTRLKVLFMNKEDFEHCIQDIENIYPEEKSLEDQASYFEESSAQVSTQIFVPLIADDVYSISYFFSKFNE
jgi:hypothetical protein